MVLVTSFEKYLIKATDRNVVWPLVLEGLKKLSFIFYKCCTFFPAAINSFEANIALYDNFVLNVKN